MAENIRKLYPPVEDKTIGSWYNDTDRDRYHRVVRVLDNLQNGNLDEQDVRWFIKCAIISKIYISKGVHLLGDGAWKNPSNPRLQKILHQLHKDGYVTHKEIDIERCRAKGICFEHVVPYDVAIESILKLYYDGRLSDEKFTQIRSKLNICLVTKEEERELSKSYRQSMPTGTDWLNKPGDEFARYTKTGVNIWKP